MKKCMLIVLLGASLVTVNATVRENLNTAAAVGMVIGGGTCVHQEQIYAEKIAKIEMILQRANLSEAERNYLELELAEWKKNKESIGVLIPLGMIAGLTAWAFTAAMVG